jgi:hypothetical protein
MQLGTIVILISVVLVSTIDHRPSSGPLAIFIPLSQELPGDKRTSFTHVFLQTLQALLVFWDFVR